MKTIKEQDGVRVKSRESRCGGSSGAEQAINHLEKRPIGVIAAKTAD